MIEFLGRWKCVTWKTAFFRRHQIYPVEQVFIKGAVMGLKQNSQGAQYVYSANNSVSNLPSGVFPPCLHMLALWASSIGMTWTSIKNLSENKTPHSGPTRPRQFPKKKNLLGFGGRKDGISTIRALVQWTVFHLNPTTLTGNLTSSFIVHDGITWD